MLDELVTLPVRVGIRVTRLWFRALEETVSVTSSAAGRVVGALASRSPNGAGHTAPPPSFPEPERAPEPEPAPEPEAAREVEAQAAREAEAEIARAAEAAVERPPAPAREAETVSAPEPQHVSEEQELVEEFAEPGAAQGAGAEIHVDAPWDGYEQMSAKQVIARFATADPAELAAVQLYEGRHRRRQTILNAVERELRRANGSGSRTNNR